MSADVLVRARLSSEQSLEVFRAVLSAAARPARLATLPKGTAPGVPPAAVPALALADLDVSVTTLGDSPEVERRWRELIQGVTGCRACSLADADLVVALREPAPSEISRLPAGSAQAPEHAARLFVSCRSLASGVHPDGTRIHVRGPGASAGRLLTVVGLDGAMFTALAGVNRSFPAGIDCWLVADDGVMAGIPRSAQIDLVDTPSPQGASPGAATRGRGTLGVSLSRVAPHERRGASRGASTRGLRGRETP